MEKIIVNATYNEVGGLKVSEGEVVYKTQVMPSQRLMVSQSKEVYELLKRNFAFLIRIMIA